MLLICLSAFLGTYFSLFVLPQLDYFWFYLWPLLIWAIFFTQSKIRLVWVFLLFYLWSQWIVVLQKESEFDLNQKTRITIQANIIEIPKYKNQSVSLVVHPVKILKKEVNFDFTKLRKIKLNWYQPTKKPKAGELWEFTLRIQPPHGFQNGVGFDYERWLFSQGISATGYVVNQHAKLLSQSSYFLLLKTRSEISNQIKTYTQNSNFTGLYQALAIADKSNLSKSINDIFISTGTAHLLVISGLHIGLLAAWIYFLARWVWWAINKFKVTALNQVDFSTLAAVIGALIYAALAGFSLPTVRALTMLLVVSFMVLKRINISFFSVFSWALLIILITQPLSLISNSFWLSFLAVLIILLSQFGIKNKSKFAALIYLQLLFSILFIPLNAFLFNQFIPASFFANLIAIPVLALFIIPLNLVASLMASLDLSWVSYLYLFLDLILNGLVLYLDSLAQVINSEKVSQQHHLILMLISALGLITFIFIPKASLKIPALVISILPWFYNQGIDEGSIEATFFDVGQGTSVLIRTKDKNLIYDLGPGNNDLYQPSKWVIKPYLEAKGIDQLDRVIISHTDQDHYGGYWGIKNIKGIKDSIIYTSDEVKTIKLLGEVVKVKSCNTVDPWVWNQVKFEFFPSKDLNEFNSTVSDNNKSCVLKISNQFGSILLTGDIEQEREAQLLQLYGDRLKSTVMLVPHHGSQTSSSLNFIKKVNADYVIVTSGYLNRWSFPKQKVIQRHLLLGSKIFNTATQGAILVNIEADKTSIKSYRQIQNELWY